MAWQNMKEVIRANRRAGCHFFDDDTMRFFGSKIESGILYGKYFITSEYDKYFQRQRLFTIREATPDGGIRTVSGFYRFCTLAEAREALDKHVAKEQERENNGR